MENSTSEPSKKASELTLELEVDQENLVKLLKVLTENGVNFKLKRVAETPPPAYIPSVFTPWISFPNVQYHPWPYGPWHSPAQGGGITITEHPPSSSVVTGTSLGTQYSYTDTQDS